MPTFSELPAGGLPLRSVSGAGSDEVVLEEVEWMMEGMRWSGRVQYRMRDATIRRETKRRRGERSMLVRLPRESLAVMTVT